MRHLRNILIAAAALVCGILVSNAPAKADVAYDSQRSTVAIWGEEGVNAQGQKLYNKGAGVIVSEDGSSLTVLTAAHLFATAKNVTIVGPDLTNYSVANVTPIPGHDLAIVKTREMPNTVYHTVTFGGPVTLGQALTVVGTPAGQAWTVSTATSIAFTAPDNVTSTLAMNCAACMGGDSGGGVFDASTGKLVGILTGAYEHNDGTVAATVAEPIQTVVDFLKAAAVAHK